MIKDLISNSKPQDGTLYLNMSDEVFNAMTELRQFLYEKVYRSPRVHNEFTKARRILTELYTFFLNNETLLKKELAAMDMSKCNHSSQSKERCVCDFIASLTDRRALDLYSTIFFPSPLV
jgi:dGTPase